MFKTYLGWHARVSSPLEPPPNVGFRALNYRSVCNTRHRLQLGCCDACSKTKYCYKIGGDQSVAESEAHAWPTSNRAKPTFSS